ncbi:MAG TPA: saccharopine dehydrogenase [Burkholderiales bacterium]|nr:saccharopine dehydrogenase [Burkholderiales bacterium]
MVRIVVLGASGNFGARIARTLKEDPLLEVIACSRSGRGPAHVALDIASPGFANALRKLSPGLVIHCAGPFQGQDYRVALAAIAAGAHYIDLADGREFVCGFAQQMHTIALQADVLAVTGASTLPALSSAVIDHVAPRFRELRTISIVIAPAQRSPRGTATVAGVLSYAGRPFNWLQDGVWTRAWGWQELTRVGFQGIEPRWAAACDVPDLQLFPQRYGAKTVEFRAALELGIQHLGLWGAAAIRRLGIPLPLERWAGHLDTAASLLDFLGSDCGGMSVRLEGVSLEGGPLRAGWHLVAQDNHGPEVPCMAAVLLAKHLARSEIGLRGAFASTGLLSLEEFEAEFARWKISTMIQELAS